jgi:hypothetical protein
MLDGKYDAQADASVNQVTAFMKLHPKTALVLAGIIVVVLVWIF